MLKQVTWSATAFASVQVDQVIEPTLASYVLPTDTALEMQAGAIIISAWPPLPEAAKMIMPASRAALMAAAYIIVLASCSSHTP